MKKAHMKKCMNLLLIETQTIGLKTNEQELLI